MKVLITNGHCLRTGVDVSPGDIVDLEPKLAAKKIRMGWAKPAPDDAEKPPVTEPATAAAPADEEPEAPAKPASDVDEDDSDSETTQRGRAGRRGRTG